MRGERWRFWALAVWIACILTSCAPPAPELVIVVEGGEVIQEGGEVTYKITYSNKSKDKTFDETSVTVWYDSYLTVVDISPEPYHHHEDAHKIECTVGKTVYPKDSNEFLVKGKVVKDLPPEVYELKVKAEIKAIPRVFVAATEIGRSLIKGRPTPTATPTPTGRPAPTLTLTASPTPSTISTRGAIATPVGIPTQISTVTPSPSDIRILGYDLTVWLPVIVALLAALIALCGQRIRAKATITAARTKQSKNVGEEPSTEKDL